MDVRTEFSHQLQNAAHIDPNQLLSVYGVMTRSEMEPFCRTRAVSRHRLPHTGSEHRMSSTGPSAGLTTTDHEVAPVVDAARAVAFATREEYRAAIERMRAAATAYYAGG